MKRILSTSRSSDGDTPPASNTTEDSVDEDDGSTLSICKKIIGLCGGELQVTSEGAELGTTFHFSIRVEEVLNQQEAKSHD